MYIIEDTEVSKARAMNKRRKSSNLKTHLFFYCLITCNTAMVIILAFYFFLCSTSFVSVQSDSSFNVIGFGAVGDGKTDDSHAFKKAWNATCTAGGGTPTLLIPGEKTFLLKPIVFEGPCNSPSIHIQVLGDVVGPSTIPEWNDAPAWLEFRNVDRLTVDGNGRIGGQGSIWWPCKKESNVKCPSAAPTAMSFSFCNGLVVSGLHLFDNPRNHIQAFQCNGAVLSHLTITAPGDSPNTDGIDIGASTDVQIFNSTIGTGDDCIAFGNDTSKVNVTYIKCGPGHGISVGSLGYNRTVGIAEQIHVSQSNFTGTLWGARIKTWQGGQGYVRGIYFQDIVLDGVDEAITIDQEYDPSDSGPNIQVSDVSFIGFHGTATKPDAISLICTGTEGCTDVVMRDIIITSAIQGVNVTAICQNAHGPPWENCTPKVTCQ